MFKNSDKAFIENSGWGIYASPNSALALERANGKEISLIELRDDILNIYFTDGMYITIYDDGQSCCESRYMHCEDEADFEYHIGSIFRFAQVVEGDDIEDEYGVHETQYCDILTSKGVIQLVCHNEHNGYYGGFYLRVSEGEYDAL